jgi:peptide/nickel transport system permease protein
MTDYILRRLLLMIPTLLGITIVVFAVMAAAPGGISAASLVDGQNLDPEARREIEAYYNRIYGLDSPPTVQYLRWLNNVSPIGFEFDDNAEIQSFSFTKGSDLGNSFRYGRPVAELLSERVPITLLLNTVSIPIIYIIAIAIGVYAATRRGSQFDVISGGAMLALWSIPTMLAGVLMIGFFSNVQYWHWFPTGGLSSSESSKLPFMPHWGSLRDVGVFLLTTVFATGLSVWLAATGSTMGRTCIFALMAIAAAMVMALALPESSQSVGWTILLPIILLVLTVPIALSDYTVLRIVYLGFFGLIIGIAIAMHFTQGSFVRGFLFDRIWHLILPVICLSYGGFAALTKLTRTAVLENLTSDYARTARAKGLAEDDVIWRHVFRNSLLPLITVVASLLPSLLGGSVIVESIFSIEGMGKLAIEAVQTRDRELVLSITLLSGLLTLIGYLVSDILYALADPRISYD